MEDRFEKLCKELELTIKDIAKINDPKFEDDEKCYDWRDHVGSVLQEKWSTYDLTLKLCIYSMAKQLAWHEDWD